MPVSGPDSVDPTRLGRKYLWIKPRGAFVNVSCAGGVDLTPDEVCEVIRRLETALDFATAATREVVNACGATFFDAADEPVSCSLAQGHEGRHFDRGFTWVPDLRATSVNAS